MAVELAKTVISAAVQANLPLVVDADGLWALSQNFSLIRGYQRCILTPNAVEFDRLRRQLIESLQRSDEELMGLADIAVISAGLSSASEPSQVEAMSRALVRCRCVPDLIFILLTANVRYHFSRAE